jgi:hypothetical protein
MLPKRYFMLRVTFLFAITVCYSYAQNVSFVVGADNRNYTTQYRAALQEINDMTINPAPSIPFPQFFIVCGDFDPVPANMAIYNDTLTYPNLPLFYPVVGNHEFETPSDMDYILNSMIPYLENVVNNGAQGTYSFDFGNVHCIVLDQYSANGEGEVDANLQVWLQQNLNATNKDHVFVFGHEPAFPRHRHVGNSLDQFHESRNQFWNILTADPRIRAYFCGHTHYYYHMRVIDPTSVGTVGYPDQEGGVYQVDVGAIGNALGDGNLTLVYVHVQDESVRFRAIASPRTNIQWGVVDEWSITDIRRLSMQLMEPQAGQEVSGVTNVTWSVAGELDSSVITTLHVSKDAGAHWDSLWSAQTPDTIYAWNTANHPDGTQYLLRVVSKDDSGFGMTISTGTFTVNNPGNAAPEIQLISPGESETISNEYMVNWLAADADGDTLAVWLDWTTNGGISWQELLREASNSGSYLWNTKLLPNSPFYQLRLRCSDNSVEVADTSGIFEISNTRIPLSDALFTHISGNADAVMTALIVDADSIKEETAYRISFDDTLFSQKVYNVLNVNTGMTVVENASALDGVTEGPLFDGLRLLIKDYDPAQANHDSTRWISGSSTLQISISLPNFNLGDTTYQGYPYPADYQITIFDQVVDTSSSAFGLPVTPMKFTVWNLTESRKAEIIFSDPDRNQTISRNDEIFILEPDLQGELGFTWALFFGGLADVIPPEPGDVLRFKTLKPATSQDIYEFNPSVSQVDEITIPEIRDFTLFQNFPNPFNPLTTIRYYLSHHSKVVLKVYNILGQEIKTLVDDRQTSGEKFVIWDGKNEASQPVASGIYFYQIQAGEFSSNRKMLFLK